MTRSIQASVQVNRRQRRLFALAAWGALGCSLLSAGCHRAGTPEAVQAPAQLEGQQQSAEAGSETVQGSHAVIQRTSGASERSAAAAEPTLIVSGPGSYWQAMEPTVVEPTELEPKHEAAVADVVVDAEQRFQVWHGFGGTFNEAGWDALMVLGEAERARAMELLFDEQNGLGLSWGRIPIGASDFALDRYTHNDHAGDVAMSHFDVARDELRLIPFVRAAQAVKGDIKFWGSPWTPPPWMKSNGEYDRGVFDVRYMDAMARYLVEWVKAYESRGIPIDHVQPQNEPGWSQAYPSCAWGPSTADGVTTDSPVTLGTFVEKHLAPALQGAGLRAKIWYGTLSNGGTFDAYWEGLSPAGRGLIEGVGLQWGALRFAEPLAKRGWLVMQTEHRCGNYPWLKERATSPADAHRNNFLPDRAPNNHAYAEESWDLIQAWIQAGVNVYNAWNMVLDTRGMNLDVARPWPQNALLVVDRESRTLRITPAYYVFRHVGQYVQPGAVRVGVAGGNALSFQNPDGSLVAILFNEASVATQTTLAMGKQLLRLKIPARGWATVNWHG